MAIPPPPSGSGGTPVGGAGGPDGPSQPDIQVTRDGKLRIGDMTYRVSFTGQTGSLSQADQQTIANFARGVILDSGMNLAQYSPTRISTGGTQATIHGQAKPGAGAPSPTFTATVNLPPDGQRVAQDVHAIAQRLFNPSSTTASPPPLHRGGDSSVGEGTHLTVTPEPERGRGSPPRGVEVTLTRDEAEEPRRRRRRGRPPTPTRALPDTPPRASEVRDRRGTGDEPIREEEGR